MPRFRVFFFFFERCGRLGHRVDVCPVTMATMSAKKVCGTCGATEPQDHHLCEPKCALCGKGHKTADKKCPQRYQVPYLLKKRRQERQQKKRSGGNTSNNNQGRPSTQGLGGILKNCRDRSESFPRLPSQNDVENQRQGGHEPQSASRSSHRRSESSTSSRTGNSSRKSESRSANRRRGGRRASRSPSRPGRQQSASTSRGGLGTKGNNEGKPALQDKGQNSNKTREVLTVAASSVETRVSWASSGLPT
ncbi:hypothetical protein HPB48_001844 [Haemaphysalis longicornis]|uniref:Uncharacterized protein n=1 Tax=Haemaphysalis longicornis TaxID=44386 RepID=A0A9J6G4W2_HAELO|nr:hypothetical protein HPB48_001844 [Haemaphysalis longicornis]